MAAKHVIEGVQMVPMGMSNAFLIKGDDGLTLIDAGYPGKADAVFSAIRELGGSPDHLKHLIFTHGHPDHIGSAAAIVRETGAKTYMHPLDIPMAESGGPFRPMRGAPGLLRQVMCKLFFDPEERMEPVAINQPLTPGEIRRSLAASRSFIRLAIARDRSRCCGVRDECCSPAMCA
jgi:glyoxylase-like metal-dependent hydrolase (beta-lactamase superfamily II)